MNEADRELLKNLLAAQILVLASETAAKRNTTSDGIREAVTLLREKRPKILELFQELK